MSKKNRDKYLTFDYNDHVCKEFFYMRTIDSAVDAIIECMSPVYAAFADLDFNQTVSRIDLLAQSTNINFYQEIDRNIDLVIPKLYRRNKIWYKEKEAHTVLMNSNDVLDQGMEILNCQLHLFSRTFFHQSKKDNNSYLGYLNKEMPIKTVANLLLANNVSGCEYALQSNMILIGAFASLYEKIKNINKVYAMYRGRIKIQNDKTEVLQSQVYNEYLEKYGEEYANGFKKILIDIVTSGALNETIRLIDKRILQYANQKKYQEKSRYKVNQEKVIELTITKKANNNVANSMKVHGIESEEENQKRIDNHDDMHLNKKIASPEIDTNYRTIEENQIVVEKKQRIECQMENKMEDGNKEQQKQVVQLEIQQITTPSIQKIDNLDEQPDKFNNTYTIEKIEKIDSSVVGDNKDQPIITCLEKNFVKRIAASNKDLQTKFKPLKKENSTSPIKKKKDPGKNKKQKDIQNGIVIVSKIDNLGIIENKDNGNHKDHQKGKLLTKTSKTTKYKKTRKKICNSLQITYQPEKLIKTKVKKYLQTNPCYKDKTKIIRDIEKLYTHDSVG